MRPVALVLLLAACAELTPQPPVRTDPNILTKFDDKDSFWVVIGGRLARCWFDAQRNAPVCMAPPIIKVPPDAWLPGLGLAKGKKATIEPIPE